VGRSATGAAVGMSEADIALVAGVLLGLTVLGICPPASTGCGKTIFTLVRLSK
jgi:hypothetical protein